jgi:hypothetical protein
VDEVDHWADEIIEAPIAWLDQPAKTTIITAAGQAAAVAATVLAACYVASGVAVVGIK